MVVVVAASRDGENAVDSTKGRKEINNNNNNNNNNNDKEEEEEEKRILRGRLSRSAAVS